MNPKTFEDLNDDSCLRTIPRATSLQLGLVTAHPRKSLLPLPVPSNNVRDRRPKRATARHRRWGVILGGGDGSRLRSLTRVICGDDRPLQFCPFFGNDSLLERTRQRAERNIPPEQVLFALTREHREYYLKELNGRSSQRIVQPKDRGTGPAILYSVLSIARMDANALVSILPSDHYYADENAFEAALDSSFDLAAKHPDSVVALGAWPDRPETELGWFELGLPTIDGSRELFQVRDFIENPSIELAWSLLDRGSAWNTLVMTGRVGAFVEMILAAIPGLLGAIRRTRLWAGSETHVEESVYERIPPADFSRHVLAVEPARLLVERVSKLGWSDLRHPEHVIAAIRHNRTEPWWINEWESRTRASITPSHSIKTIVP
jgi:mannose-1-phosphate guanylyltransferase